MQRGHDSTMLYRACLWHSFIVAAHSWKSVPNNTERYRDALYRHLNALESGELVDPESGLPHWDHICCNALFLSQLAKDNTNA